jgi:hypothetical protein
MEVRDPLEDKCNRLLSEFEQDPPERVWEHLRERLHPGQGGGSFWTRLPFIRFLRSKPLGFHLTLGGIALGLALTLIYLDARSHYSIRGHAYAGHARLKEGSAMLFLTNDKSMPWDSLSHACSAVVDRSGHFRFSRIRPGRYLLRVSPGQGSQESGSFLPTWFERRDKPDSCDVLILAGDNRYVDVFLMVKPE